MTGKQTTGRNIQNISSARQTEAIYRRYRFFENGKAKERTKFVPAALSQAECSKVKSLVWMCKS